MKAVEILYEDPSVMVVVKPAGMPSQPERSTAMDMVSYLKNLLAVRDHVKNPYISVVHRLDRPVGGVMVYAKTKAAAAALSAQISGRTFGKEYLAVVWGTMSEAQGTLEDFLVKDGRTNLSRVVSADAQDHRRNGGAAGKGTQDFPLKDASFKDAKKAVLEYQVLGFAADGNFGAAGQSASDGNSGAVGRFAAGGQSLACSLLKIRLHTGRHHQIRVQMAHCGHPIAGDRKYGNSLFGAADSDANVRPMSDPYRELGLFSCSLEFIHPTTKKRMRYTALPEAAPFLLFDCQTLTE